MQRHPCKKKAKRRRAGKVELPNHFQPMNYLTVATSDASNKRGAIYIETSMSICLFYICIGMYLSQSQALFQNVLMMLQNVVQARSSL